MTTYNFEPVKYRAQKSGKCVCGKRVARSATFKQTINPWNKNSDGEVKTYSEIWNELKQEAAEWKSKPVYHNRLFGHRYVDAEMADLTCGQQIAKKDWS